MKETLKASIFRKSSLTFNIMFSPIVEEFFETKTEFLQQIQFFEKRFNLRLLKKLVADKDEVNFFSWLTEVRFGMFFGEICNEIKNDFEIEFKRPDWLVTINGQRILAEVFRLNTREEEYRNSIDQSRQLRRFQKDNPEVPIISRGSVKTVDLSTLGGGQFKMARKEEKYRNLVQKHKLPFIICVAPTIDTFLFELDFADFLIGNRGFFKRDVNFGSNVTGVLLHTPFNQFFYYHNDGASFKLSKANKDLFQRYYYSERG